MTSPPRVRSFEIGSTDAAGSKKFYQDAFGWTFIPEASAAIDSRRCYAITAPGTDVPMGTLFAGSDQDELCLVVECADVSTTMDTLSRLGASTVRSPVAGRSGSVHATVHEVRGNLLGLRESKLAAEFPADPAGEAALNSCGWFEIGTRDADATLRFYTEGFGWTFERTSATGETPYFTVFDPVSGEPCGGIRDQQGMDAPADYAIPVLLVADVPAALGMAEAAGATVTAARGADLAGTARGKLLDPRGNLWGVFSLPEP